MKLSEEEVEDFHKIYDPLLDFANNELDVIEGEVKSEQYMKALSKIRDQLYENAGVIDDFIDENPEGLNPEQLKTVEKWRRHFIRGKFFILKYLKNYTVFLSFGEPPRAYGVLSHLTDLKEMFHGRSPLAVEAVILPFHGRITYDGIIAPYRMKLGGNISKDINGDYQEAKHRFGIIESLPGPEEEEEKTDEEKLRFYMKSKRNRERYHEEIQDLRSKNRRLESLYYKEIGKKHARKLGKRLRETGIKEGWFAILEDTAVASGAKKEEAEKAVEDIVPEERQDHVYYYHLS